QDVRRKLDAAEISIATIYRLDQHVSDERLVNPRCNALDLILEIDEADHLVLACKHERHLSPALHSCLCTVVGSCGLEEPLRCRREHEHALGVAIRRWRWRRRSAASFRRRTRAHW